MKISTPCAENWDKMTPSEQGRFCQSCQKNVLDFTNKKPSEIRALVQEQKGSFCGRITKSQLDYYNATQSTASNSYFRKWSLAAALSVLIYGQQINAEPLVPLETTSIPWESNLSTSPVVITNDSVPKKVQGIIITGKVVDIKTTSPVPYATVRLQNSSRFTAKTDEDGYYKLILPKLNEEITLESFSSDYEFKTIKIVPSKDIKGLVISLKEMENVLMGYITN